MIKDEDAIAQAQGLYAALCERLRKRPHDTVGEIAFAEGAKFAVLFDGNGKLAAVYRVIDDDVVDLDGADLARVRAKLTHRKVRR